MPELSALPLSRGDDGCGVQVEEVVDELVRVLRLDTEGLQDGGREVFLVEGDDHAGIAAYGRRQNMTVVRIG